MNKIRDFDIKAVVYNGFVEKIKQLLQEEEQDDCPYCSGIGKKYYWLWIIKKCQYCNGTGKINKQKYEYEWGIRVDNPNECYKILTKNKIIKSDDGNDHQHIADVYEYSHAVQIVESHNKGNGIK